MKAIDDEISVVRNGSGINSTISMSNTMKMMLSRKKRIENGTRALFFGSNPHSKGEVFSRSDDLRVASTQATPRTRRQMVVAVIKENVRRVMDWKLKIIS